MKEYPVRTWPFALVYLGILAATIALLRLLGRGWTGAVISGLVLAGLLTTLVLLAGSRRR
jgi:hypothetical protein